ncbi:hypothetical protein [Sphingomonas nostoxanthinifaciens]|uniref:hypothetical protein n=1 Tax=Sphingomonas nostoxanthinifaciens TaxID=2872652 RepID=UPI001CC1DE25|nr:hypothetical protein [Sphingomonas nostoxanthinifaciens]UAK26050.1 hypothetical protein K8P63_08055 [Sphingomonas nostoxanthinifaciens]
MSESALLRVVNAQAALIAALDAHDLETLDAANVELAEALGELQAHGAWRERPELRDTLIHALKSADAARGRINFLADSNQRRLERLVSLTRGQTPQAYRRNGRFG